MVDEEKIEEDLEDAGSDWLSEVEEEPEEPEGANGPEEPEGAEGANGPEEASHWTVGAWGTLKQWRCNYCQFDALSEDAMVAHYEAVHKPRPPRRDPRIVVADRFGNEVT